MRTTLNLDTDVLRAAKSLARAKAISMGAAVSQLARRGLEVERHDTPPGIPCFQVPPGARIITLDDVQRIEDEA